MPRTVRVTVIVVVAFMTGLLQPGAVWSAEIRIGSLSKGSARPGDNLTVQGQGFGAKAGTVVVTGLRVESTAWSDAEIASTLPQESASATSVCMAGISSAPAITD
jgi:hypothetical protein